MREDQNSVTLSQREQQTVRYATQGLTDVAIANKLGISANTVLTYWRRIRIKIGPYSRTELVSRIMRVEQEVALTALREANQGLVQKLEGAVGSRAEFFETVVMNAPDAILLTTENGTITTANTAALSLFGYTEGELTGVEVAQLIPASLRSEHKEHIRSYVLSPTRRTMGEHLATLAQRKDGSEFSIRASLSAIPTPTGLVVMCAIRPIGSDEFYNTLDGLD